MDDSRDVRFNLNLRRRMYDELVRIKGRTGIDIADQVRLAISQYLEAQIGDRVVMTGKDDSPKILEEKK